MKKRLALILASAMLLTSAVGSLASCSGSDNAAKGHVYYLNFKPESDEAWQALAAKYTEETGVQVDVLTAAQGTYEQTLASEIAKADAPTLFQVNGPVGLASWKDYCYDMSSSAVYGELTSDSYALKDGSAVYGIAYASETYGMIVNTKLLKDAGHELSEITNFDTFKEVVEDITANSGKLGFSAFTNASLKSGDDWRIQTHLANLPLYYEYQADGINNTDAVKGTYLDNFRNIIDLYVNNATCKPAVVDSKTVDEARQEFLDSQAVFYQNGTWEYAEFVKAEASDEFLSQLQMIPIYIGVEGEENQGLCSGTENFWAVNGKAAEEDIQATLDFLEWVVTSEEGTTSLADEQGLVSPFKKAKEAENIFVKQDQQLTASGKTPVRWDFTTMPSQAWKNDLGSAIATYAKNQNDANWEKVKTAFVDGWAKEVEAAKNATTEDGGEE